jgi:general secretion pathway protein G
VRKDPWGNAYIYRAPGTLNVNGFDIVSTGKDGQEGNEYDVTNAPQAK